MTVLLCFWATHSESRKVVVEIPYPLRSGNLLTCLMSCLIAQLLLLLIDQVIGNPCWQHAKGGIGLID